MTPDLPLRDIHLPDAISWWPPAIGWWLLILLSIAIIVAVLHFLKRPKTININKVANTELEQLKTDYQSHNDPQLFIQQLSMLMRRICLSHYSRDKVAALTGEQWLTLLDEPLDTKPFSQGAGRILVTAPYQKNNNIDVDAVYNICQQWLTAISQPKSYTANDKAQET